MENQVLGAQDKQSDPSAQTQSAPDPSQTQTVDPNQTVPDPSAQAAATTPQPSADIDWEAVTDMMAQKVGQEIYTHSSQVSNIPLYPGEKLTVKYEATFGELLVSTLIVLLISVIATAYIHHLIFRKRR